MPQRHRPDVDSFERTLLCVIPWTVVVGLLLYAASLVTRSSNSVPFYLLGITTGILVYLLTFKDIVIGIAVLIACIGLSPEVSLAGIHHVRFQDFIVPGLLLAWLTRAAQERSNFADTRIWRPLLALPGMLWAWATGAAQERGGPANTRIWRPLVAYTCAMLFSTGLGLAEGVNDATLALSIAAKYIEYGAIFLILINSVKREEELRALVVLTLLVAVASALIGFVRLPGELSTAPQARLMGPPGETSNIFGGYLALNLSIVVGLLMHARNGPARLMMLLGTGALVIALLYTQSRTSYVAFGAASLAFGLVKERRGVIVVLLIFNVGVLVAPDQITKRIATIASVLWSDGQVLSLDARINAWSSAFYRVAQERPIFGFGLGSVELGHIDSEYARVLSDTGFLGVILFGWLLVRVFHVANRGYDSLGSSRFHKGFAAGYWIAFGCITIHAIAATSFTSIRTMETFMLLTGLFVAQFNRRRAWRLAPYDHRRAHASRSQNHRHQRCLTDHDRSSCSSPLEATRSYAQGPDHGSKYRET